MRLGACYNVFDGHELLEWSVRSIREEVCHIVVVYQTVSNFGEAASPSLLPYLLRLKEMRLVDELVPYDVRPFHSVEERRALVSAGGEQEYQSAEAIAGIGPQFFNEMAKRQL